MPLTIGLIGGGLGLVKGLTLDRAKEDRQRKLAAETSRYSPWTGLAPGAIQEADPLGGAMQFGVTGASLGQGMENQKFNQGLWGKILGGGGNENLVPGSPAALGSNFNGRVGPWTNGYR